MCFSEPRSCAFLEVESESIIPAYFVIYILHLLLSDRTSVE